MRSLAEADSKLLYINPSGEFYFQEPVVGSTSVWHFSGLGDDDLSFGKTIIDRIISSERIKNVYNRVRVRFASGDTVGSFKIKEEDWNWGDNSSSFRYGVRTYEYANIWLNSTTASTVADNIFNEFRLPKSQIKLKSKFLPGIEVGDRVDVTHRTGRPTSQRDRYGQSFYGSAIFGDYKRGSIELNQSEYEVRQVKHDFDKFITTLNMDGL